MLYEVITPFPLMHIDTGHNFPETMKFRDDLIEELGVGLIVGSVQESIDQGRVAEEKGKNASRNALQTTTLLDAIETNKIDCAIGGGRRDEEQASRITSYNVCYTKLLRHLRQVGRRG